MVAPTQVRFLVGVNYGVDSKPGEGFFLNENCGGGLTPAGLVYCREVDMIPGRIRTFGTSL
jgi:hypothetical protein